MSMSDPIADLLTRIRNASSAKHRYVDVRHTKVKTGLIQLLQDQGFVESYIVDTDRKRMRIFLKYAAGREPLINSLVRVSSPGLRRYVGYNEIPKIDGGMGLVVLSTPQGILDGESARRKKTGGELLCFVR